MQTDKYSEAYDIISTVYEDALAIHHKHAQVVLDRLTSTFLNPCSRVLDVACGTGKPVSAHFANNGHNVTGIDYSPGMLELARTGVPNATFHQADMTSWQPSDGEQYDLIIASHCFYTFSVAQIRTMIYNFALWTKRDGLVVIGMSNNQGTLDRLGVKLDHRGWVEGYPHTFLGQEFKESSWGSGEAWADLIKSAGLEIIDVDCKDCIRTNDPDPDMQFYIIARKTQANPLLGPFPIPETFHPPITIQPEPWKKLNEKREMTEVNKTVCEALRERPGCRRVLCVSKETIPRISDIPGIEFQQTLELPFSDVHPASFDGVLLDWTLHLVPSPGDYMDHAIKAVSSTGDARVIIVQASPDNELVNLINEASEGLNLPIQHHGSLLNEAEKKCKAAGFQNIKYIRTQGFISFGSLQGDEKVESAASILSQVYAGEGTNRGRLKERLTNILKIHFLFKKEITSQTTILFAERNQVQMEP